MKVICCLLFTSCVCITIVGCSNIYTVTYPLREYSAQSSHEVTYNGTNLKKEAVDSPIFYSCDVGNAFERKGDPRVADEAFLFALMAANTYRDLPRFDLLEKKSGWKINKHYRGALKTGNEGFQADTYIQKNTKGKTSAIAVAYRGTNQTEDNSANYSIWWPNNHGQPPAQYTLAAELAIEFSNQYANVPIYLTGHSLGGALANYASHKILEIKKLDTTKLRVYMFNPSTRSWVDDKPFTTGRKVVIREEGEILTALKLWNDIKANREETFNFVSGNPIREHSIYDLARGLLWMSSAHEKNGQTKYPNGQLAVAILEYNLNCKFR
ncbi:lipase family protein [Vibrio jasicida]|uniref:lipase family protein n=1 Tax=Vibrio jasicida TaxID=766224 RepID=UPI0005F05D72|nr:Mbeg1-like protein [Vibrio jasicida]